MRHGLGDPGPGGAAHQPEVDMERQTSRLTLDLEIMEIERREKAGGSCTSSSTSDHCTCACFITTVQPDPR